MVANNNIRDEFTIMVDYSKSLGELTKGRYDYVDPEITEEHFPLIKDVQEEKKEKVFKLYRFNEDAESDYVICHMGEDGYGPAIVQELLAFGETHPKLQKEYRIIELGSVWVNRSGDRRVVFLNTIDSKRRLDLHWFTFLWIISSNYRFLGVKKIIK